MVVLLVLGYDDLFFEFQGACAGGIGKDPVLGSIGQEVDCIPRHACNVTDFGNVAGLAVNLKFGTSSHTGRNHRHFTSHCLKSRKTEAFRLAWHKEQIRHGQDIDEIGLLADETNMILLPELADKKFAL